VNVSTNIIGNYASVYDRHGKEILPGMRVLVAGEYPATVVYVDDMEGDVDDEGRSRTSHSQPVGSAAGWTTIPTSRRRR
jgi:hypothetical protein